ncbi:MAG: thioredoxin family protein, partial [Rhodospirillales bacterium]|nr:thioredoxin family protein [Rhodospirillales bacterium]
VAADQVLLVDVTADWCVTCVVNKRLVLDRPPVRNLLEVGDIVGLRGDWTLPDSDIAAYLATHQRLGVPFNAVYGPGLPEGEVLPELLTADVIIEAVQRAKRAKVR